MMVNKIKTRITVPKTNGRYVFPNMKENRPAPRIDGLKLDIKA